MNVDELIVIKMPKTTQNGNSRKRTTWSKRALLRAIWQIRDRILMATGEDIFNVFVMTDCVEARIRGDLLTRKVNLEEKTHRKLGRKKKEER